MKDSIQARAPEAQVSGQLPKSPFYNPEALPERLFTPCRLQLNMPQVVEYLIVQLLLICFFS
jgi:hypothetical protein